MTARRLLIWILPTSGLTREELDCELASLFCVGEKVWHSPYSSLSLSLSTVTKTMTNTMQQLETVKRLSNSTVPKKTRSLSKKPRDSKNSANEKTITRSSASSVAHLRNRSSRHIVRVH